MKILCKKCHNLLDIEPQNTDAFFICEKCGRHVKINRSRSTWLAFKDWTVGLAILIPTFVVIIGIPAWLIYSMYSCATTPKTEVGTSNKKGNGNIKAWVFTQYLVEEYLKSPKTAKFPFGGAQNHVEETVPGIFIIRSYVDSQNSFGATIRTKFFCKLQQKANGKFEVIQLTFQ